LCPENIADSLKINNKKRSKPKEAWNDCQIAEIIKFESRNDDRHLYSYAIIVEIVLQSLLDKKCNACYTDNVKQTCQGGGKLKTKIQELRKKHKLSQEELALAVGVTRQTITSLECEKYTASLVLAYKIARYFHMAIEDVFDFSEVEVFENGTI